VTRQHGRVGGERITAGPPAENRHLIATELARTLVVEAAAGTGKTTELVGRIVRLLEKGAATIDQIVAVTFSEKAAGELKLRLREELERARSRHPAGAAESKRLSQAVYDFEEAHVSTIHGFCADLLRERPVESCVDPAFVVLTESQAGVLFDEAFTAWLHANLADPGEGVRRSLRRPVRWNRNDDDDSGPIDRLHRAAWELKEWRDHDAPWTRPDWDRRTSILALVDELRELAAMTARPLKKGDNFSVDTLPARRVSAEIERLRRLDGEDLDAWEAALVTLADDWKFARARKGSGAAFAQGISRDQARAAYETLLQHLDRFRETANADIAALLREEMRGCLQGYEARKQKAGALDFLDLLIKARDLVRDNPDVRRAFQQRFRFLLVDEFQDTDPLQAELLLLLATPEDKTETRPGALFIVGDPKQSIYRFRRADVGAYARIAERLSGEGAQAVQLQTSYRAVPGIQRFVNAAFGPEMTGDVATLQANYVPLRPHRKDHPEQPSVIALPLPRPYGLRGDVTQQALMDCQPRAIGEFVRWLVSPECPWTVEAPDPETPDLRTRRRIAPRDICLLFRRFLHFGEDITRAYVDALEARGVPHLLVGGKTFHEREEVDAIRTALTAIEWPEDELSVFATLHGPLFALGDEELLAYHALAGGFHPYHTPAEVPEHLAPVVKALQTLRELHASRNYRPVADTVGRLLAATRAHAGFILWRGGEQVLANVLHISDLARRYEGEGGMSFRGFVDALRQAAGSTEAPEAPILEEGSEGVRLMTVHKAKGLEFPIVILADIGCRLSLDDASRHLDPERNLCAIRIGGWSPLDLLDQNANEAARDAAEGVRLAYVAATRARDLLVVPAVGDGPYDKGWLRPLNAALYPPVADRQDPKPAPGVPAFTGKDTVLDRPEGQQPDAGTVRPGAYELHDPALDEPYTVVWWDPLLLDRESDEGRGVRREDLIARDAAPELVAADRARFNAWSAWRALARETGEVPSLRVRTATEFASDPDSPPVAGEGDVPVEDVGFLASAKAVAGRRFGVLVHALLAMVPLDASPSDVKRAAEFHARLLDATDEERAAAAAAVTEALAHPRLAEAREAERAGRRVLREAPLSIVVNGVLVDGQADLAYETGEGWVVVDFKTDVALVSDDAYRKQVALYAEALGRATGRPARGVILRV
jgi:ATP-dependent exoDNAse (exonuclease V) beta subunit